MNLSDFVRDLASARERATALREALNSGTLQKDDLLLDSVEQLQTTVEELQVAQEELRQQNDELISTREQLEIERHRYRDLFEFAPDAYLLTDEHALILEANSAAALLLQMETRFLVGKPVVSFVMKADQTAFRTLVNRLNVANTPGNAELILRMTPRVGDSFDAAMHVAVSRNSKGPIRMRWLVQDITEQMRVQHEIRTLNAELEQRVKQRTAELQQANVLKDELLVRAQEAQADAEAANRTKDEFLAIASHELRTPLTAIQGWAEMLTRGELDEKMTQRGVEIIARNVKVQTQIISDLLDVSRILSGKLSIEAQEVDLGPTIQAAIEMVRQTAEVAGVTISPSIDQMPEPVIGDPARLQQIVWNLLSNGVKFTPRGGTVGVRLHCDEDKVALIIKDSGVGISPEFLPHVFEPFRQADSKTTRKYGGLGLGLSIVRSLVEVQGGTVSAASDGEGRGATFSVVFPYASQASQTARDSEQATAPFPSIGIQAPSSLEGIRVLVVDDDQDSQGMLTVALLGRDAEVQASSSANAALETIQNWLPDVIISDIGMPGEDGYHLIAAVRSLPPERGGNIPAIALTGYASPADRMRAIAAGYQTHISKPVEIATLIDAVWGLVAGGGITNLLPLRIRSGE